MRFRAALCCLCHACLVLPSLAWDAGELSVTITKDPMNIAVSAGSEPFLEIVKLELGGQGITSVENETTDGANLVLTFQGNIALTLSPIHRGIRFYSSNDNSGKFKVCIKDHGEQYYGLHAEHLKDGEVNTDDPSLRGQTRAMRWLGCWQCQPWLTGTWGSFFMTTSGYGSFIDTWTEGEYVFADPDNQWTPEDQISLSHDDGTLDWYVFYGPTGEKIHEGYFKAISEIEGGMHTPKKVPIWACGPLYWQNNHKNKEVVLNEAQKYAELQVPATGMWVDRPYGVADEGWDEREGIDWHYAYQPPELWIDSMHDHFNIKVTTWISPANMHETDCPECVPNNNRWDWTIPSFRQWFEQALNDYQYTYGIMGHKIDRAGIYKAGEFSDGTPANQSKQKYPYLTAKYCDEILRGARGEDQLLFATFTYNRTQPYLNALWGGDAIGHWPGLQISINQGVRAGFLGYPVWGSDGGGYSGSGPDSSKGGDPGFMRWLEFCLWSGMFQIHQEWSFYDLDPADHPQAELLEKVFKDVSVERMRLLPYIYSIANTSDRTGVLMKPMAYVFPEDPKTHHLMYQYMFGPSLLVAPVFDDVTTREVYLPAGKWFDYYDLSREFSGDRTIEADAPLERFPVFAKANSIYLSGQIYDGNSRLWIPDFDATRHVDVNAFPGEPGQSTSFIYVDYLDENKEKVISMECKNNYEVSLRFEAMPVPGTIRARTAGTPGNVFLNGEQVGTYEFDENKKLLSLPYPANQAVQFRIADQEVGRGATDPYKEFSSFSVTPHGSYLRFCLPSVETGTVYPAFALKVYDMKGRCRLIRMVEPGDIGTGPLEIAEDRIGAQGTYLVRLEVLNVPNMSLTSRVVLH